jgi:hypothetical protein
VELNLDRIVLGVTTKALAPVIADGVGEDVPVFAEACCNDAATNLGVALEAVLGVLVPEVKSTVGAGGGEGTMLWVEGYGIYGVNLRDIAVGRVLLAMALKGEIKTSNALDDVVKYVGAQMLTWCPYLPRTEWRTVPRWSQRQNQSRLRSSSRLSSAT